MELHIDDKVLLKLKKIVKYLKQAVKILINIFVVKFYRKNYIFNILSPIISTTIGRVGWKECSPNI